MYLTETQRINQYVNATGGQRKTDLEIWYEIVKKDMNSPDKAYMQMAKRYFKIEHSAILDRDFTLWYNEDGEPRNQKDKANNHLIHPYFTSQVQEKMAYLLNNAIAITHKSEKAAPDLFREALGKKFDAHLQDRWATFASVFGSQWLYPYPQFDADTRKTSFRYRIVDSLECIPIWDTRDLEDLVYMIRYYQVTEWEGNDEHKTLRVEVYDAETVSYYRQVPGHDKLEPDVSEERPEYKFGHFEEFTAGNEANTTRQQSWGRVPFIELKNNASRISDLKAIKSLVDALDLIASLNVNDFEDLQEEVLKAFGTGQDPATIRENYKRFKVITGEAGEGADVDFLNARIEFEGKLARERSLEQAIAIHGKSVDVKLDKFGSAPSGVALEILYQPLDLKAGAMERQIVPAMDELAWFVSQFYTLIEQPSFDPEGFEYTFKKTMIVNKSEQIDNALKSRPVVSDETAVGMHPEVDDVEAELAVMKKEGKLSSQRNPDPFSNTDLEGDGVDAQDRQK